MKRADMVVFKIDLDKGFPVVVALMHLDVVQYIVRKIELRPLEQRRQVVRRIAWSFEKQAVAIFKREALQVHAGRLRKLRGSQQLSLFAVGPAVYWADDIAARIAQVSAYSARARYIAWFTAQHDRLSMSAHIRDQFDAIRVAHKRPAGVLLGQATPIADFGYKLFVPY